MQKDGGRNCFSVELVGGLAEASHPRTAPHTDCGSMSLPLCPPPLPPQVIVNARKPDFFTSSMSLYEVVTEDGLMRPAFSLRRGGVYCGGSGECSAV